MEKSKFKKQNIFKNSKVNTLRKQLNEHIKTEKNKCKCEKNIKP